ncbi:hypothetical protein DY000_02015356 [Brassica cretica]|uniref:Uncharacterized protein n=1 Tax=Brassica cretica TaxID=69181 RepID=A0ABQ7CP81_BRACR|nr:hypothetical protein DY000_02015356 [Brassica cretica]
MKPRRSKKVLYLGSANSLTFAVIPATQRFRDAMRVSRNGGGGGCGGGSGGRGGDMVVMKVTVALLVNVVVDEDLVVSGCVDVIGRVADGAFGGGYESEELWTGISWLCVDVVDVVGRVVDGDLMVSGCVDVVDVSGRVVDGALGGGYESGKRDGGDSGSSDSNGGGN